MRPQTGVEHASTYPASNSDLEQTTALLTETGER